MSWKCEKIINDAPINNQCQEDAQIALTPDGKLKTLADLGLPDWDYAPANIELYCDKHGKEEQASIF